MTSNTWRATWFGYLMTTAQTINITFQFSLQSLNCADALISARCKAADHLLLTGLGRNTTSVVVVVALEVILASVGTSLKTILEVLDFAIDDLVDLLHHLGVDLHTALNFVSAGVLHAVAIGDLQVGAALQRSKLCTINL